MTTRRSVALRVGLFGAALCAAAGAAAADAPSGLEYPRVSDIGGVYPIEGAEVQTRDASLVLDVTDEGSHDGVHPGLEHAARALNLYRLAGMADDAVSVAVVVHGKATPMVLTDAAYRREFGTDNPNTGRLEKLREAGVDIRLCGQSMRHHGFRTEDVAKPVTVALSAMTALVDLQSRGYALIP